MKKRKIAVVVTARPSYSRVRSLLKAINKDERLELQLILSSSVLINKYGQVSSVIEKDGFRISEKLWNVIDGANITVPAKTTGLAIIEISSALERLKPDIVITIADRYETIAASIAASYQNIPLAHLQGGEVTGNIDEKVRHANTKLADLHLVSNLDSFNRVIKLGEDKKSVFITGCPSIDIANNVKLNNNNDIDFSKYGGLGQALDTSSGYLVVLQHPVSTNYENAIEQTIETIEAIREINMPTFWFWPNVDIGSDSVSKAIRVYREKYMLKNFHFYKNFEPDDFLKLINNSKCLIGNSSVGIRESSFLGVPVVNIGNRQNRRLKGENVRNCEYNRKDIIDSINFHLNNNHKYESENIYGDGFSSKKIVEILASWEMTFHKTITY